MPTRFKNSETALPWRPRLKLYKATNNYFDPEEGTAYSYDWWCYVRRINGKYVFNAHRYSMTTCGHQSSMRRLLEQLGIEIYLEVDFRESLTEDRFKANALADLYRKRCELLIKLKRKGIRQSTKVEIIERLAELKRDARRARELGSWFSPSRKARIKEDAEAREAARLHELAEERKARLERKARDRAMFKSETVFNPAMI